MRSGTFFTRNSIPYNFHLKRFMCILAHMLTEAMLTAMTSLHVDPCESGPPVFQITLVPTVHSCRVHLARISSESCPRRDWASATLYTLAESDTRRQPGETWDPLTRAHGLSKKWDFNEVRHERRGYMRGSKARRVFPSTLSLSPCLGFPRQECTAGITDTCWALLTWASQMLWLASRCLCE